ncbi:MAG: ATP-binding protein [Candidatus Micrarchaeota archaeon]|nr:ATP-binding protein [Candidatus Micrarchaeota archaeon]
METALVKDYISNYLRTKNQRLVPRELNLKVISGKATTVIGPRRAGKTSLLMQEIAKYNKNEAIYLDFEDIALKRISATDSLKVITEIFAEVSGRKAKSVFLDEIQNVTDWQSLVRTLLDRGYIVYVTGSSSKLLTKELATQLRGRGVAYLLLPFSFYEFLVATNESELNPDNLSDVGKLKNILNKYLESGGFPEIVLGKEDKDKLLVEYRELIFFKDFVERQNAKSIEVARYIFNFVTQCFASEMSVRKVINSLKSNGIPFGRNTIYDYVEKLQDTMVFFFLDRYSTKINLRSSWPKKVYLADNGLAWRLPYDKGRLMENLVFLQLKRKYGATPISELYYYRDIANSEVDFVVKDGIDIKELLQVTHVSEEKDIKGAEVESLLKVGKGLKCKKLTIITWDYEKIQNISGQNINFIPLWKWLLD